MQIGGGIAPGFDEPVEMLLACHGKIRQFCAQAQALVGHVTQYGVDEQAKQAAVGILRYFDVAAPLHHADEETDLFPALKELGDPAVVAAMATLASEHVALTALWQKLRPWLQGIAAGDLEPLPEAALDEFVFRYRDHAEREEQLIFPAATKLTTAENERIGHAMALRRKA